MGVLLFSWVVHSIWFPLSGLFPVGSISLPLYYLLVLPPFIVLSLVWFVFSWGEISTDLQNSLSWLRALTFNESSDEAAKPEDYFKEVEARVRNMEETYGRAQATKRGEVDVSLQRALELGRCRLSCLRKAIYEGLGGDRPVAVSDWTGHPQKERGDIWVVAVTRDRVVIWEGSQSQRKPKGGDLHPSIKEVSLDGVDVECRWALPGGSFRTALVDSRTRQVLHSWATPDWNGYAPALRLAIGKMRRKAHFARYTLPVIGQFLVAAGLIATLVGILLKGGKCG